MDRDRVSSSINSPPYFDGKDDSQWKVMMIAFLQSQEDKLWNIIEKGWIEPTKKETETSSPIPKPRGEWTVAEQSDHKCDTKARYSLFAALSDKERKRITNCPTAKASWELLQTTHEANKKVKAQKLQSLVLEFEEMTMREDESVDDFHSRLINVTNQCHGLGDSILEHRIVKKFLRALPPSFEAKQIAIEEAQDLDTYSLDELVGNLKTFESKRKKGRKEKTIALSTLKKEEDPSDFHLEEFALLTKQFKKFLKSGRSFSSNSKNFSGSTSSKRNQIDDAFNDKYSKSSKPFQKKFFGDKPKCFECQGYGHLAADCANKNYKSQSNRAFKTSWSDSESETQSDHEEENVALIATTQNESSDESDDDEHSEEVASNKFQQLYKASKIMIGKTEELKDQLAVCEKEKSGIAEKLQSCKKKWEIERNALVSQVETLQENLNAQIRLVNSLTSEKNSLEKSLHDSQEKFSKFSIGSDKVSKMIGMGKVDRDKKGLGFLSRESSSKKPTIFVKKYDSIATCLVAFTALSSRRSDTWYLDSGCSRHMTSDKNWFSSFYDEVISGSVTFGDGKKAKVVGKGIVTAPG
ncbi:uncharacterized protein LOC121053110 [Rosa chinensis]|uniref:uncharacterized protein LOC121053110 n=1 Tax=Rosa chinensis TaxID=74649 RepID=UPI001AD949D5|nr:uncharacterized protein LOC121053110 [Rosa chinensis]